MESDLNQSGARARRIGARGRRGLAAGALVLTGAVLGWSASGTRTGAAPVASPSAPIAHAPGAAERTIGAGVDSYAALVDEVAPAVVTVRSERRVRAIRDTQLPDDPFFRQFFGDRFRLPRGPQERREGGLGSGVIVRADGYILTNNHVVDGAEQVRVELTDGRAFDANVVGSDPPSDLAVLKIDGTNLHTLPLGDSEKVRVGDVALAVGNPLGVGQTVTMGIISAKGRSVGAGDGSYQDFIQTDAPINEGNSGGALVSTRGELIGINSQILSTGGGNIGIGFAIPANMARHVMTQLIDQGQVRRGLLGVTVQQVTPDIARSLGMPSAQGALVNSLQPGGTAERAGIRRGDVITAIEGQPIKDVNSLKNEIAQMLPGTDTRVTVVRDGKEQIYTVKLGELQARSPRMDERRSTPQGADYGLTVEPLTRERAQQLGVNVSSGLVVTDVQPSSRAAQAGIRDGDVIEEVDGKRVETADAFRSALSRAGSAPALVLLHRGEATIYTTIERHTS
jgi:serine protease Do